VLVPPADHGHAAEADADDLEPYGDLQLGPAAGGDYASQTSFRISGGRGSAEEVAELFCVLGPSGPEDLAIPPALYFSTTH
jgi:hypothetical protein